MTPRCRPAVALVLLAACAPAAREPEPAPAREKAAPVAIATPIDTAAPIDTALPPDWETARRQGVEFRAIGQEPGWILDVDEGRALRYVGDYGETRVTTPAPPPEVAPDGTRTWRAQAAARALVVVVRPTACHDGMSGAAFTHTVTVRLDGREVRGCGQATTLGAPIPPS